MKLTNNSKINAVIAILTVLIISLVLNVYQSGTIKRYKLQIDRASCENIETIRDRNETTLSILDKSISTKSLTNEELLTLYKNYSEIANLEIELWEHYLKISKSISIFNKNSKVKELEVERTEILWKLEDYIYSYLVKEMTKGNEVVKIDDQNLSVFIALRNMSSDVNTYFNNFINDNLYGLKGEDRANKIIKEHYWIDMLFGMVETTNKYINYEFFNKE